MDHVLVGSGGRSPLAALDRNLQLFQRPFLNLCNGVWIDAILDACKQRSLRVMLTGQLGNMSFSYSGLEALPGMLARGKLGALAAYAVRLPANGVRPISVASHVLGPFLPAAMWRGINRLLGRDYDLESYSAISPEAVPDLTRRAIERRLDVSYRPRKDPFEARLWVLSRVDAGNYNKGHLGGWGIDVRDPSADRRLVELCLSIPAEQYLRGGRPRALAREALADRLPPVVLRETRKGLQAADWHEGLEAARTRISEEVERFADIDQAKEAINLPLLRRLLRSWPIGGWNSHRTSSLYRLALLRGVSAGHFIRKATGFNR